MNVVRPTLARQLHCDFNSGRDFNAIQHTWIQVKIMHDRDGEREEMKRICEAHSGGTDRQGREERERRCLFAAAAFDIIGQQRRRGNIPRKDRKVGTSNAVVSCTVDHSCCAATGKSLDKVTFDQRAMRQHFLSCLEKQHISPFPASPCPGKVKRRSEQNIVVQMQH